MPNDPLCELIHPAQPTAQRIAALVQAKQLSIATAESCTAGRLATALTRVPGASEWFRAGIVAYTPRMKAQLLQVPPALIERDGVVSASVAALMAIGALQTARATVALSSTGYTGPGGGTPAEPVGSVWCATALVLPGEAAPTVFTKHLFFSGSRDQIADLAAQAILSFGYETLRKAYC